MAKGNPTCDTIYVATTNSASPSVNIGIGVGTVVGVGDVTHADIGISIAILNVTTRSFSDFIVDIEMEV